MKSAVMLGAVLALTLSTGAAYAKPSAAVVAAVADKGRPEADTKRDAARKPAEMLEFAGIKPGQTVVDFLPGGGYFTRILSKAVGPKGTIYAAYPPPRAPADPAKPPPTPAAQTIAADPAYANVKTVVVPFTEFAIPQKADVIWTSRNYHDLHLARFNLDVAKMDKSIFEALKPGGYFIVLDHAAAPGTGLDVPDKLHRINPDVVKSELLAAGFKYVGESTVLRNPADDHTKAVFDNTIQDHTDQFIYKFQRPK